MPSSSDTLFPYVYFGGRVVPAEEATVPIASHSIQYGSACFGGLRGHVEGGVAKIMRLSDHYQRLLNGIRTLGWQIPDSEETFRSALTQLIEANRPSSNFYIRPVVFTRSTQVSPVYQGMEFELAIYMLPLEHYFDPNRGLRLMTSSWRKFADTSIPTKAKASGAYINSCLATTDAKQAGYDDALMLDQQGYFVEASVANILLSYQGQLILPPTGNAALDGITMRTVVQLLTDRGRHIRREVIDRSMVYAADELLLTGTAAQVTFAASVDQRPLPTADGPGPICLELRSDFAALIKGSHPRSEEWVTSIAIPSSEGARV